MASLSERLHAYPDAPAESWKAKPGDCIEGTLVEYVQADTSFGPCWIATLAVDASDGHGAYTASVWLSHKVLREAFSRQRPKPGERLGIRRLSDGGADGRRYARYALIVDRPSEAAPAPDWDALGTEGGHEQRTHGEDTHDDMPF